MAGRAFATRTPTPEGDEDSLSDLFNGRSCFEVSKWFFGDYTIRNWEAIPDDDEGDQLRDEIRAFCDKAGISIEDSGRKRKKRASDSSRRNPNKMTRLLEVSTAELVVPIRECVERCENEPGLFLDDFKKCSRRQHPLNMAGGQDSQRSIFLCSLLFTMNSLEKRRDVDRIRWCFQMVYWWIAVTNLRPHHSGQRITGRRLSPSMKDDLRNWLTSMSLDQGLTDAGLSHEMIVKKVSDWSKCGSAIVNLEMKIGRGCLFYIGHLLDENFLLQRYAATGKHMQEIEAHFRDLDLEATAQTDGADKLSERILRFLGVDRQH